MSLIQKFSIKQSVGTHFPIMLRLNVAQWSITGESNVSPFPHVHVHVAVLYVQVGDIFKYFCI